MASENVGCTRCVGTCKCGDVAGRIGVDREDWLEYVTAVENADGMLEAGNRGEVRFDAIIMYEGKSHTYHSFRPAQQVTVLYVAGGATVQIWAKEEQVRAALDQWRTGKARVEQLEAALQELVANGTWHDLNPTMDLRVSTEEMYRWFSDYCRGMDERVRAFARQALE